MTRTSLTTLVALLVAAPHATLGQAPPTLIPPPGITREQEELDSAVALWAPHESSDYVYQYQRSCECPPAYTEWMLLEVRDGALFGGSYLNGNPMPEDFFEYAMEVFTVEGAFDLIQRAIDQPAAMMEIAYDATLGYPTAVSIDWDDMIADEETYFQFKELEIVATGDPYNQDQLDSAAALWASYESRDYDYRYQNTCFCHPDYTEPMLIEVRDGSLFGGSYLNGTAMPVGFFYYTVEESFELIQRAIDQPAAMIEIAYDATLGYPTDVYIDWDEMIWDEETSFEVMGLEMVAELSTETSAPSLSPTPLCEDMTGDFTLKWQDKQKDCNWISRAPGWRKRKRCRRRLKNGGRVRRVCPVSCGAC